MEATMKKRFNVLWGALIALVMTACSALDGGDLVGPGGGFVFYDKGSYSDGWRYLEAAPESAGTGDWEKAVQLCEDYSHGGYADWYLPGKDELKELLDMRSSGHGSNITDYHRKELFWSSDSDEEDSSLAWGTTTVSPPTSAAYPKTDSGNAWPVRRF
jgi:hypothetical protein